jgi:hypothetical protein
MRQVASLSSIQVIEEYIFHKLMGQGATRNLSSYGRQSLKVSAKISQKLAMYTIDQISWLILMFKTISSKNICPIH